MRKSNEEINLLSVSFIDLLVGALGAVIFLFIVIPKVTMEEFETLKSIKGMEIEIKSIDSLITKLKSSVPEKDYNELVERSASLQASLKGLGQETARLETALKNRNQQYQIVAKDLEKTRAELQDVKAKYRNQADQAATIASLNTQLQRVTVKADAQEKQLEKLGSLTPELKSEAPPLALKPIAQTPQTQPSVPVTPPPPAQAQSDAAPESTVSFNFPFIVMLEWKNKEDKVHLYMRPKGSNNWCFYQTKRQRSSFGTWDRTMKKLNTTPFESIIQKNAIIPGEYEVYAQVTTATEGSVDVGGFIAMKAPEKSVRRINIAPRKLNIAKSPFSGGESETYLGTVSVSADAFNWSPKN